MSDNGDGSINIEGYDFDHAKNGVDSQQVENAVKDLNEKCRKLAEENEKLSKENSHLSALTRLAEKTVIEADSIASEIKSDAEKNAREMVDNARNESGSIYSQTLDLLKDLEKHVNTMTQKIEKLQNDESGSGQDSSAGVQDSSAGRQDSSVSDDTEELIANFFSKEKTKVPPKENSDYENEIGLEMLPPVDINNVMQIIENLEELPKVEKVELISRVDKPLVIVCLKESVDIMSELNKMPNISEVSESTEENQIRPTFLVRTKSAKEASSPKS